MSKLALILMILALGGCASTPQPEKTGRLAEPQWVSSPSSVYDESRYISAVGYGLDRASAEKSALGALTAIFGQSVQGETKASYKYSEAVADGFIDSSENSEIESAVKTSFAMDSLIGAELKDFWFDGVDTYYSIAVMDRPKSSMLYSDLIESNQRVIRDLVSVPEDQRYTLDSYARYSMAATIADASTVFMNVLSVISPASAAVYRSEVRRGDDYRLECLTIAQNTPIAVSVDNDSAGRVRAAFSQSISDTGFKTGGSGSPYTLDVSLSFTEVVLPENPNKFVRYVVNAKLVENATENVLFPYSLSGREGHASLSEAENRAVRTIEQKILESYGAEFEEYLNQLSSVKR
ncbi:LPP20 family lipoprotein [Breznakiella homolactica]|uniref:LPP20 family lipoprotein n=1 Tax=Breznakiella homolactica TaxID=2798577 RepID=A0A7T8BAS0_9SPIR|nr:LPP20 family lipoprotein [Breznakiella homolactica]QQO09305.1 LPP20 family lipoprotein [Breznakiella homolactica]